MVVSPEEGGGFLATIPDLPGCMSRGATEHEALEGLKKAKSDWIENAVDYGHPIPEPKTDK